MSNTEPKEGHNKEGQWYRVEGPIDGEFWIFQTTPYLIWKVPESFFDKEQGRLEVLNELQKKIIELKIDLRNRALPSRDIEKGWDAGQLQSYERVLEIIESLEIIERLKKE